MVNTGREGILVIFSNFTRTAANFLRRNAFYPALASLLLTVAMLGHPAHALLDRKNFSETEKVAFAFHYLSNIEPEFERWVKKTDRYKNARTAEKQQILNDDLYRLQNGYHKYHPDEDLIHIEAPAQIRFRDYSGRALYNDAGEKRTKHVVITIPGINSGAIPFELDKLWVAVVAKDYDFFVNLYLTEKEYQKFINDLGYKAVYYSHLAAVIDIFLRPVDVDMRAPVLVDDQEMWLMLAEIGSFTIWQREHKKMAWEISASWFVSDTSRDLLNLYEDIRN
ncbi:MAG: hypothetical protein HY370_08285 [Proteobacteria bacterium]|nr:hypothetical protein [Pseudomonadota bacterium]